MAKAKKNPKAKKTTVRSAKRSSASRGSSRQLWLLLVLLGLLLLLIASVGLLGRLQRWFGPNEPVVKVQQQAPLDQQVLRAAIEQQLGAWGIKREELQPLPGKIPGYRVDTSYPDRDKCQALEQRLHGVEAGLTVTADADKQKLSIDWREGEVFLLLFGREKVTTKPLPVKPPRGRIAIIMDDLGRDRDTAQRLLQIDLQVTMAILPDLPSARAVAELAHRRGREVLIHLPMEPEGYPAVDPGAGALFVDLPPDEIRLRMDRYLQRVPYAVGANNHMGSRFTTDRQGMAIVLAKLKDAGMFFIDSRTTAHSIALAEATRQGIAASGRDVFLDNVEDVAAIGAEIDKLAALALQRGEAIGICHPHATTLKALREAVPRLQRRGVEVVSLGRLLEKNDAGAGG